MGITLKKESGGLRYYLHDKPLHAGTGLELWLEDLQAYVPCSYEARYDARGEKIFVTLALAIGGQWEDERRAYNQLSYAEQGELQRPMPEWVEFEPEAFTDEHLNLRWPSAQPSFEGSRPLINPCSWQGGFPLWSFQHVSMEGSLVLAGRKVRRMDAAELLLPYGLWLPVLLDWVRARWAEAPGEQDEAGGPLIHIRTRQHSFIKLRTPRSATFRWPELPGGAR